MVEELAQKIKASFLSRYYRQAVDGCLRGDNKFFREQTLELKGAIFQHIALQHMLATHKSKEWILYGPQKTLEFYQDLLIKPQVIEFPFDGKTLMGISVSDGLLFRKTREGFRLVDAVECTLSRDPRYFQAKYEAFLMQKYRWQSKFGNVRLAFVTPKDTAIPKEIINRDRETRQIKLGFNHGQFEEYFRKVLSSYYPYGATVWDYYQRMLTQGEENIFAPEIDIK